MFGAEWTSSVSGMDGYKALEEMDCEHLADAILH